jgi:hypothetical protein
MRVEQCGRVRREAGAASHSIEWLEQASRFCIPEVIGLLGLWTRRVLSFGWGNALTETIRFNSVGRRSPLVVA